MAQKTTTLINAPNLLMKKTRRSETKTGSQSTAWSLTYAELDDFEPWLDVVWLVDMLTQPILRHVRQSIINGEHPGTGAKQPDLNPKGGSGKAAEKGIRPKARGNTTGSKTLLPFFDEIRREKIKHNGKMVKVATQNKQKIMGYKAVAVIKPHPMHRGWVAQEADRGVEYFDVPDSLVDTALNIYLSQAVKQGPIQRPKTKRQRAKDAKKNTK